MTLLIDWLLPVYRVTGPIATIPTGPKTFHLEMITDQAESKTVKANIHQTGETGGIRKTATTDNIFIWANSIVHIF